MTPVHQPMDADKLRAMSVLALAHVGDAVYELLVRDHLARLGPWKLADQHRKTIAYVAAPAQAEALARLTPRLTDEERAICRRGRNARVHGCPSGCTVGQYHAATALETLFGQLWLAGQAARVQELFAMIVEEEDAS